MNLYVTYVNRCLTQDKAGRVGGYFVDHYKESANLRAINKHRPICTLYILLCYLCLSYQLTGLDDEDNDDSCEMMYL